MNSKTLNVASLEGCMILKGGEGSGGGGGATIKNQEKSLEITENGTTEVTADAGFTGLGKVIINTNVPTSGGGGASKWTGHADAEGLRAIGWTDEDIAYYQENGVNWNAEDDEYHKVTDDNKALYGVLTASNISTYKERIVYLPKIDTYQYWNFADFFSGCNVLVAVPWFDTSQATSMARMFQDCNSLVCIPPLDTAKVKDMSSMFYNCYALVSIPPLDTANVTNMSSMFQTCYALASVPLLNTAKVTDMSKMFYACQSLASVPLLDTSNVTSINNMFYACQSLASVPLLNTAKVTEMKYLFYNCYSLVSVPQLDTSNVTSTYYMFQNCYSLVSVPLLDTAKVTNPNNMFNNCRSLVTANLKNATMAYQLNYSALLSKESLLYLINNEAATSAITIKLKAYAYTRLSTDPDIVAALAAHPNISISQ